jgi:Putative DNA-binding domain
MTTEEFEHLLTEDESATLDFKRMHYNLGRNNDGDDAKLIKDIIAFTNTIREKSAYIIIGVELNNNRKVLHGLDQDYDESQLQDKVKDKVNPKPIFKYYTFEYQKKRFGIFEFPLHRYERPISPLSKMKGLEVGKVYFRRGSSNSEASHIEAIEINSWITNVVRLTDKNQIRNEIIHLISTVSEAEFYSTFLAQSMEVGIKVKYQELVEFCRYELVGWNNCKSSFTYEHRNALCLISGVRISRVTTQVGGIQTLWQELLNNDKFYEKNILNGDPISQVEDQIRRYKDGPPNQFTTLTLKTSELFGKDSKSRPDYDVYIYWHEGILKSMYSSSKQKLIQLLTNCLTNFL